MQYPMIAQPQYGFAPTMPMMPSMNSMPPAMMPSMNRMPPMMMPPTGGMSPAMMSPMNNMAPATMAEGGLVSAAKNVQSKGRNGDSMLVHMTPGEVGGLQALAMQHGGSLTINPQTGLPEANFLKSLMPTLLGFGLNFLLPGSGALIGLGVGGLETLRTGDIGKGLMAGLGAYGGANLAGSLTAAGAGAAGASGAAGAGSTGLEAFADPNFIAETGAGALTTGAPATVGAGAVPVVDPTIAAQGTGLSGAGLSGAEMSALKSGAGYGDALSSTEALRQGTTQAGQAVSNLGSEAGRQSFLNASGGYSGLATDVGLASAPLIGNALTPKPYDVAPETKEGPNYEGPYTPSERRVSFPDEERRRRSSEFAYFTPSNPIPFERGGSVPMLENGGFVLTKKAVDGLGGGSNKKGQQVASRGLGAIPIRGPGTGTSDSIKTSIDRKRPALVSNGEAYVPKKQVAKHGGAKKFYALMKKAERRA